MRSWMLVAVSLLSCSSPKQDDGAGTGSAQPVSSQAEQTQQTACPEPVEVNEERSEKKLTELSYEERTLLGAVGMRDSVAVKMPQSVARWLSWFKTNLPPALSWTTRTPNEGKSAYVTHDTLLLYSKIADSDEHLPSSPLADSDYDDKGYGVVVLGGSAVFPLVRVTHRALDFFSDSECTATVSVKEGRGRDNAHFTVKFTDGNTIKLSAIASGQPLSASNIIFWVGKDDNIKLQRVVSKSGGKDNIKFETYTRCGEKIPSLDQQCVGRSQSMGAHTWSCDGM